MNAAFQLLWLGVCFLFIGLSFMSGEAVEENAISYHAGVMQLLHAAVASPLAMGAKADVDGSAAEAAAIRQWLAASGGPWLQLLATDLDAGPSASASASASIAATPAVAAPRCVWRTDGWAYLGMLFIAWVMLWLISILNEVRGCAGSRCR